MLCPALVFGAIPPFATSPPGLAMACPYGSTPGSRELLAACDVRIVRNRTKRDNYDAEELRCGVIPFAGDDGEVFVLQADVNLVVAAVGIRWRRRVAQA